MFDFGAPEDTAQLFWASALKVRGPKLPEAPVDEMSEEELRNAIAYCYLAHQKAQEEGASEEVMQVLIDQHDEVFEALVVASDRFRDNVLKDRINWMGGWDPGHIAQYNRLAGV